MIINKMKRSEKHVNRVQKLMHLLLLKERKNHMVLLTTINLFPVDETNTTRSKLNGSYSKNNTIFCWRSKSKTRRRPFFGAGAIYMICCVSRAKMWNYDARDGRRRSFMKNFMKFRIPWFSQYFFIFLYIFNIFQFFQ